MYKYLLFSFCLFFAAVPARSQEVLLSAVEMFSIEPGRILRHEAKLIGSIGYFWIDVVKVSDIRGDTSRKAIRVWARNNEPNEQWALNFDPVEAYGVLNLLEHCQRTYPQTGKGAQTIVYTTSNSLHASITLPERDKASWGVIHFRQFYAYSNVEVPRRITSAPYRDLDKLVELWKQALETLKEL
ncbi:hypothetical protein [Paraflavitalea pollutisoli]|uniref:hypothetical protein n=1 Tax=Paraflavitalea pollutisoli TaxID=3034143 RepID=UPI0023EBCB42|nr:hypothetical protein [Paraflavitalea sp. H1-2-19X]